MPILYQIMCTHPVIRAIQDDSITETKKKLSFVS